MNKSDYIKLWRHRTKDRIVESMGGKCALCSYNKCNDSLALHHIDPKEKDFSFGSIRANPRSWITIANELRKCVLVCHNCHSEIHEGMTKIPDNVVKFNEDYADFKRINSTKMDSCPECGNDKPTYFIVCSRKCASTRRTNANWDSVNLAELYQTTSVVKIAEQLGCSDGAVHKRLKKLGLK